MEFLWRDCKKLDPKRLFLVPADGGGPNEGGGGGGGGGFSPLSASVNPLTFDFGYVNVGSYGNGTISLIEGGSISAGGKFVWFAKDPNGPAAVTGSCLPTAYPWNPLTNAAYDFGIHDGTAPKVVITGLTAGQQLAIQCVGSVTPSDSRPASNSPAGESPFGPTSGSVGRFPCYYIPGQNAGLVCVIGVFTDGAGIIKGTPIQVDGGGVYTVPAGATQFQIGVNDDHYADNTGPGIYYAACVVNPTTHLTTPGTTFPKTVTTPGTQNFTLRFTPTDINPFTELFGLVCAYLLQTNGTPIASILTTQNVTVTANLSVPNPNTGIFASDPVIVNFGSVQAGDTSDQVAVRLYNAGTGPYTITALAVDNPDFAIAIGIEPFIASITRMNRKRRRPARAKKRRRSFVTLGFSKAGLPIIIPEGAGVTIYMTFTPSALGTIVGNLLVTTNLSPNPYQVPLTGLGVLLVPVATLGGGQRTLIEWAQKLDATVIGNYLDPADTNSEQAGSVTLGGTSWGDAVHEKTIFRLLIVYKDLGQATLTFNLRMWRKVDDGLGNLIWTQQTISTVKVIGSTNATNGIIVDEIDIIATGALLEVNWTRAALSGPVELLQVTPQFEPRGEHVENT